MPCRFDFFELQLMVLGRPLSFADAHSPTGATQHAGGKCATEPAATAGEERWAQSLAQLTTKNLLEALAAQHPQFGSRARASARSSRPASQWDSTREIPGTASLLPPSRYPTSRSACR